MWNREAIASCTSNWVFCLRTGVWTVQFFPPTCWTVIVLPPPALVTVFDTCVDVAAGAVNLYTEPPLKSTLTLRPKISSAATLTPRIAPEILYHSRCRPTKSNDPSPRYSRPPMLPSLDITPPSERSWPRLRTSLSRRRWLASPWQASSPARATSTRASPDQDPTTCAHDRRTSSWPAA